MEQFSSRLNSPRSPGMVRRPLVGIVGAGRVGGALARTLTDRGYTITAVYSRSESSSVRLAEQLGSQAVIELSELASRSQLILLAVPDDAISSVCEALSQTDLTDKGVAHTSGVTPVSALSAARMRGALTGGIHPILPISRAVLVPAGVTYGLEADREPLRGWLAGVVEALDGVALWLRPGVDRSAYHASAIFISNYLVTLYAEALGLLTRYATDEGAAADALNQLARATLENIAASGPVDALTGPIARGDAKTVSLHLYALSQLDPELAELYRQLGQRTLRLAAARRLPADLLARLMETLEDHANNDP